MTDLPWPIGVLVLACLLTGLTEAIRREREHPDPVDDVEDPYAW